VARPRADAQAFADHLNGVLNRTVTESRLSLVPFPWSDETFELSRNQDGASNALELSDGFLYVRHMIKVVKGHCQTLSYTYSFQSDDDRNSWLVRWCYHRAPPKSDYPYPLGHMHIRADLIETGEPVEPKHLPTGRVPLELVCLHLIEEWGTIPLRDDWRETLDNSLEGFYKRQTAP
jgi:hypothetical protein